MSNRGLLSSLTIAVVGLGSRSILNYLCSDFKAVGLSRLLYALDPQNSKGKGVLTVSNHISVLDDPLMWGILPSSHYTHARSMRWALGASDICFTNPLFSAFFRQGQVLETFRGGGIRQPAVDRVITLLNAGEWVHIFPEGKISQPPRSDLQRLKWGIGRILMEVEETPIIIPTWLTGFDTVMPETREFPRFLPRPGKRVSVTFGEPDMVERRINARLKNRPSANMGRSEESVDACIRADITRIIQEELGKLGQKLSGEAESRYREGKERYD